MALTQISTAGVKDDAVTAGKIPANAVGSSELADNAVDTAAIAADAVTNAKVANNAINTAELVDGGITTAKIANSQITADKIASGAVNTSELADGGITTAKIANSQITAAKLASDSVTNAKVADDAIGIAELSASGTASSSTFLRGDNSWTTVNTDLVGDTSPQLGADLDTNGHHILLDDDHAIKMGASTDFQIQHNTNENYIDSNSGHIYIRANVNDDEGDNVYIQPKAGENAAVFTHDGAVELYHDNSKVFETISAGGKIYNLSGEARLEIQGYEGNGAYLQLNADDGDDNADYWRAYAGADGTFHIQNYASGSWETNIKSTGNGAVELYHNNSKKFETYTNGVLMGSVTHTLLWPNVSNSNSRSFGFIGEDGSYGKFELKCSNGQDTTLDETCIRAYANGGIILYHDDMGRFETASHGVTIKQPGDRLQWTASSGSPPQLYNDGSSARDLKLNIDNDHHYTFHQNGIFYQQGANSSNGGAYSSPKASYPVRAFLNFDDEDNVVHSKGNVSSVSDTGTGQFDINWAENFPDTHYACVGTSGGNGGSRGDDSCVTFDATDHSVGSIGVRTRKFTDNNWTNSENTGFVVVR